jgi:hypothetical protein
MIEPRFELVVIGLLHRLGVVLAQRHEGVAQALGVEFLHHLWELLQRALIMRKLGTNDVSLPDRGGTSQNRITVP